MIQITHQAHERMCMHAEESFPFEVCGFLIGKEGCITRISRSKNVTEDDARDRFELDPAAHLRLQRELRENGKGERILGIYHSHPESAAEPSAHDIARSTEPEMLWVIMSVRANMVQEVRVFTQLGSGITYQELPLDILDD